MQKLIIYFLEKNAASNWTFHGTGTGTGFGSSLSKGTDIVIFMGTPSCICSSAGTLAVSCTGFCKVLCKGSCKGACKG